MNTGILSRVQCFKIGYLDREYTIRVSNPPRRIGNPFNYLIILLNNFLWPVPFLFYSKQ